MKQNDLLGITVDELLTNYIALYKNDECIGVMLVDDALDLFTEHPDLDGEYFVGDIMSVETGKYLLKGEVLTIGDIL